MNSENNFHGEKSTKSRSENICDTLEPKPHKLYNRFLSDR